MKENRCTKVRLQFMIDSKDAIDYQKQALQKLCDIFAFWYELVYVDDMNYVAFFNVYFVNDPLFLADYANIIKVFALHGGYLYLGNEEVDYPDWE